LPGYRFALHLDLADSRLLTEVYEAAIDYSDQLYGNLRTMVILDHWKLEILHKLCKQESLPLEGISIGPIGADNSGDTFIVREGMRWRLDLTMPLSADQKVTLDRVFEQYWEEINKKIVVLHVSSNPIDSDQLKTDAEIRDLAEIFRNFTDKAEFHSLMAATTPKLKSEFARSDPTILQFSCHADEQDGIELEDDCALSVSFSTEDFKSLLNSLEHRLTLIILTCCSSLDMARDLNLPIPVIAGNDKLVDDHARAFSRRFYTCLLAGYEPKAAFTDATKFMESEYPNSSEYLIFVDPSDDTDEN